ncbi:ubiquitin carboxyl-terminal hydrolase 5 [Coprinopsis cinerea okayama7|uniref:Ubiquitin carboxyl-terminal hydrolase 5 n=1 Tax=Coprinopsis cinerea (strain Okayama-7 / 130 / ATCC MYA-4618 / FGSC 9003) TaxID=240176 RepID=A8N8P1_COPC7|nr:ubiquitin carboxyl-terminal hydrolase 5 [Coprinopsis cinerea okayama7\|eukprot:XP_001831219.2 ubiquitin carboxyl-terminal hydrolase 5 [Coprinopsis cinerea okayama7\
MKQSGTCSTAAASVKSSPLPFVTGYLLNQGWTQYINVNLHHLFFIGRLRKVVKTEQAVPETTELTRCFGWRKSDGTISYDPIVFNEAFLPLLQDAFKGSPAEGVVENLFRGKMRRGSEYKDFYGMCLAFLRWPSEADVQLFSALEVRVHKMKSLRDSLLHFTTTHQFDSDPYVLPTGTSPSTGEQVTFVELPPILQIGLTLFELDGENDNVFRVDNESFELPEEIDLGEFMDPNPGRVTSQSSVYRLFGATLHQGRGQSEGYTLMVSPRCRSDEWLHFVEHARATACEGPISGRWGSKAKIATYVRALSITEVLGEFDDFDKTVPPHIVKRSVRHPEGSLDQDNTYPVSFITDDVMRRHTGVDLFDTSYIGGHPSVRIPRLYAKYEETLGEFKNRVARYLDFPAHGLRIWVMVCRQNGTVRPNTELEDSKMTMKKVYHIYRRSREPVFPQPGLAVYVGKGHAPPHSALLFLKYFDIEQQRLSYIGSVEVSGTDDVQTLVPIINHKMGWEADTDLVLYGRKLSDEEIKKYEDRGPVHSLEEVYTQIARKLTFLFQPYEHTTKFSLDKRELYREMDRKQDPEFAITIDEELTVDELLKQFGRHLQLEHDPGTNNLEDHVRFFTMDWDYVQLYYDESVKELFETYIPAASRRTSRVLPLLYERF